MTIYKNNDMLMGKISFNVGCSKAKEPKEKLPLSTNNFSSSIRG